MAAYYSSLRCRCPRTDGTEFGLWHTPKTSDAYNRQMYRNPRVEPQLSGQAILYQQGGLPPTNVQKEDVINFLFPTPDTNCHKSGPRGNGTGGGEMLSNTVALLPTPTATLATHGGPNQRDSSGRPGLQMAAMMWPTPKGSPSGPDFARMNRDRSGGDDLATAVARDSNTGQLNPTWVEWLMGYPLGWTDLKHSGTP